MIQKQTQITERNVKAALAEVGGGAWLMNVAPQDELAARRIVCDGVGAVADGGEYPVVAPVRDVRLHVDARLPRGVWEVAASVPDAAPAAKAEPDAVSVARSDLEKVLDAVDAAVRHHAMRDESNAALHLSPTRLSPLTSALAAERDRLRGLLSVR